MRNRISVTHLDNYQYFLDNDMTEEELYERLYGDYCPTPAMSAGTALHKVLEGYCDIIEPHADGFSFYFPLDMDCEIIVGEPHEREVKHVWQGVDGVDLVGMIDVETPYCVYDHKLTANFDPERYFNSWQWRAYLTMRDKRKFTYQVFECSEVKDFGQQVNIKAFHALDMYAYEGMQDEVKSIVSDLSELINKWRGIGLPCQRKFNQQAKAKGRSEMIDEALLRFNAQKEIAVIEEERKQDVIWLLEKYKEFFETGVMTNVDLRLVHAMRNGINLEKLIEIYTKADKE